MSTRFSRWQFFLILAIETVFLAAVAAWVLFRLGRLYEPFSVLVAMALVLAGDIVTALLMEHLAPTRITVEPGEGPALRGEVLSGFEAEPVGVVQIRGERWQARLAGQGPLCAGDRVKVVGRDGLTLEVRRSDDKA